MTSPADSDRAAALILDILSAADGHPDYFALLRVPRDAEPAQVREAYLQLAKLVHPDLPQFSGDPALRARAVRAVQMLAEASATLIDPERRRVYVRALASTEPTTRRASAVHQAIVDVVVPVGRAPSGQYSGPVARPSQVIPAVQPWRTPSTSLVQSPPHEPHPASSAQHHVLPRQPPSPGQMSRAPMATQEPPQNAEAAASYLQIARQHLARHDWVHAQDALELALPVLTNRDRIAECKVLLGQAIFSNTALGNPRLERAKSLWNEVAVQHTNTPAHAQAAYHLAVWHKLFGEPRLVAVNLQACLLLQPHHVDALREKRLLDHRQDSLADLGDLEARARVRTGRSASGTHPAQGSWIGKLFGGGDKKK